MKTFNFKLSVFFLIIWAIACSPKIIPIATNESLEIFNKTEDYNSNTIISDLHVTDIIDETDDFIRVSNILNKQINKRDKKHKNPWAIKYKNENYFSLNFQENHVLRYMGGFGKFDIEGKYCIVAINFENTKSLNKNGNHNSGLGLTGVLVNEMSKAKTRWINKEEKSFFVILINTSIKDGIHNSLGYELKPSNFNKLLDTNYKRKEINEFSLERIYEIVIDKNK